MKKIIFTLAILAVVSVQNGDCGRILEAISEGKICGPICKLRRKGDSTIDPSKPGGSAGELTAGVQASSSVLGGIEEGPDYVAKTARSSSSMISGKLPGGSVSYEAKVNGAGESSAALDGDIQVKGYGADVSNAALNGISQVKNYGAGASNAVLNGVSQAKGYGADVSNAALNGVSQAKGYGQRSPGVNLRATGEARLPTVGYRNAALDGINQAQNYGSNFARDNMYPNNVMVSGSSRNYEENVNKARTTKQQELQFQTSGFQPGRRNQYGYAPTHT